MKDSSLSRKDFLRNSALGFAGLTLSSAFLNTAKAGTVATEAKLKENLSTYFLKNVRLETGFEEHEGIIIGTITDLFCIEISDGKIKSITANKPISDAIDAKGLLMLPAFKDIHIHLDKTYYGDKWQANRKRSGGIKGIIDLEKQMIPELLKNSTYKAEKIIELLQAKGTSFARSHVNIEPTSKLQSLKNLQIALEHKKDTFETELVAFPQHGVFYTDSVPYLKEAAQMNIDFIGGLDPFTVDGAIEKTIDFTVQLALDNDKGIDIHLHETGDSGLKTVEYLIKKVNENEKLKGRTYLSHCFILAKIEKIKQDEIAEKLAAAQIGIVSTIPIGGLMMPIPALLKRGVNVLTGNDSIVDHWNVFGSGSVLEKANLAAQLYGKSTEFDLSRMLQLATAGIIPLDNNGSQQWPKAGDHANFILIDASCSAEAVARISEVKTLIHNGNIVY